MTVAAGNKHGRGSVERGFTLIELLVGVALGAVLLLALYTTFFGVMRTGGAAEASLGKRIEIGRFLDLVSREVHSAYFKSGSEFTLFRGSLDGLHSALEFTAFTVPLIREGEPSTDLIGVNYYVEEGEEASGLIREVRSPFTGEKTRIVMIEEVEVFELSYYNGTKWAKAWDASLEGRLPAAVSVKVVLKGGEEFKALARTMIR